MHPRSGRIVVYVQAPPPLEAALEASTRDELRSVVGAHTRTLDEWLGAWRDGLVRFEAERSLPRDQWSDDTQHRHDWAGILHLRDIIEAEVRLEGAQVPGPALAWLDQVDDFFRSFTEETADWAGDDAVTGWWWQRLPLGGPVRAGWWADQ